MRKIKDLTGQKFGRLTVIKRIGSNKQREAIWLCKCECGNEKVVVGSSLRKGQTQSCGCLMKERIKKANTKHGCKGTKLYECWHHMKERCYLKNFHGYFNYGGRGITMCDEWKNDFITFRDWAISNGYKDGLTIERIDVNGNYCPENCRWITMKEQQRNKRNTFYVTYKGVTKPLVEWSEVLNISYYTLRERLVGMDWSIEKTLTTPVKEKKRHV